MEISIKGGVTLNVGEYEFVKCDIDLKLTDKEILFPKKYEVHKKAEKGISIITEIITKHLDNQAMAIKESLI